MLVDISAGGAFVISTLPFDSGGILHLRLPPPLLKRERVVSAMVVRKGAMAGASGYGVMFVDVPADIKKELLTYVGAKLGASTGVAAKNARLRRIQKELRERGARERSKEPGPTAAAAPPSPVHKPKTAEALPEWARGMDLRELYKDALESVRNEVDPAAGGHANPNPRKR